MIASADRFVAADLPAHVAQRVQADAIASPCLRNAVLASALLWGLIAAAVAVAL